MLRRNKRKVMVIIMVMVMGITVNATEVVKSIEEKTAERVVDVEGIEKENTEYLKVTEDGLIEGETIKYGYGSAAYEGLMAELRKSIELDAREGLEGLRDTTPTKDSIEMMYWGPFLEKYIGKESSAYPSEDITMILQNRTIQIKTDKRSKEWVYKEVMPTLEDTLIRVSDEYPVVQYRLAIESGTPLTELEVDKDNLNIVEGQPVYPLAGKIDNEDEPQIIIYNTGVSYGFMLDKDYLEVLKGYHNESADMYRVEGKAHPGSVGILAYITTPRNLKETEMTEKTIRDFGIYEDLAVNLITKELVNYKNLSNTGREETYKDFRIDEEALLVVPIKDTVVIVQPEFYEGTKIDSYNFLTYSKVDFTPILTGEGTNVLVDGVPHPLETYRNEEGYLEVYNGNASPFIVYARPEHIPYERVIKWAYGPKYDLRFTKEQRDDIVDKVKGRMESEGLKSDYKVYMNEAGQGGTKILKKAIPITMLILGVAGFFIYKRKKRQEENVEAILFGEDDEDEY